ncbi:hypothetical protein NDN16_20700 [Aureimonas altamirensis]|nr:hypothetical protein [Aureimonas altamirensis]MCM2506078.1 hypothetical protein [Aureimonas altamirensis]
MRTSEFSARDRPYSAAATVQFPKSTNDTLDLVKAAQRAAHAIYRDGFRYSKAGIVMDDLIATSPNA